MAEALSTFGTNGILFGEPFPTYYHLGAYSPTASVDRAHSINTSPVIEETEDNCSPLKAIEPPQDTVSEWNTAIRCVVISIALALTPLILLALAVTMVFQRVFNGHGAADLIARSLVLPALRLDPVKLDELRSHVPERYIVTLKTEDGIELEGVQIPPQDSDPPTIDGSSAECGESEKKVDPAQKKWIVYFNGNNGCYEKNFIRMKEMAEKTGAGLISINYRGVGRSKGTCRSSNEIIRDGRTPINHLLKMGVPLKNILIYGYSLGGGVGTAVAAEFPDVNLVVDRSFESVPNVPKAFVWIPVYRELITWAISQYWDLNSYVNIQKVRGMKRLIVAHQDLVIGFRGASLYQAFIRNNQTPPPTLHLHYRINPNQSLFDRIRDYVFTHMYDIPSNLFITHIQPWLNEAVLNN